MMFCKERRSILDAGMDKTMDSIIVPDLGDGIGSVEVILWHVQEGSFVKAGDDVVELLTDKATFNVASPREGMLKTIHVPAGQEVSVGTVLGELL
jgi:pyruvate/2-oxoglutarate dehydrogenase complex dihydrolipoamide acyltransferase (E2) component